jgi:hypothetical protein
MNIGGRPRTPLAIALRQAIFRPAFNRSQISLSRTQGCGRGDSPRAPTEQLTRHHKDNPLILEEWLQGSASQKFNTLRRSHLEKNFGTSPQKPIHAFPQDGSLGGGRISWSISPGGRISIHPPGVAGFRV